MNVMIFALETLVMTVIFTLMILIPLSKNPVWWIHDFPKDIQEEYFKTHERIPAAPLSKPAIFKKAFAIVLVIGFMTVLVRLCGARGFRGGFLVSYAMWLIIDWYDCFILDWVFFANLKKIRLPGTEHMDRAYHQKMYHFVHSIVGMAVGLIPCLITGLVMMLIG
ncbi:MAG: hypothetical protein KBS83_02115 [Lachnospiraceae bacterium]|nr:hypothetical protein [Candidatus Equihabitans merdae]